MEAVELLTCSCFFFFNDTATTEIYTLSLHDARPIWVYGGGHLLPEPGDVVGMDARHDGRERNVVGIEAIVGAATRIEMKEDRKSTRLNSSHANISYAVFCLKKKNRLMNI